MASEVTDPSYYTGTNYVPVAWSANDNSQQPSFEWVLWNLDNNTFVGNTLCKIAVGNVYPANSASRFLDFISAASPLNAYNHAFMLGGIFATAPSYQNQERALGWQFASDANPGGCS